jgi:hypothetical protein
MLTYADVCCFVCCGHQGRIFSNTQPAAGASQEQQRLRSTQLIAGRVESLPLPRQVASATASATLSVQSTVVEADLQEGLVPSPRIIPKFCIGGSHRARTHTHTYTHARAHTHTNPKHTHLCSRSHTTTDPHTTVCIGGSKDGSICDLKLLGYAALSY